MEQAFVHLAQGAAWFFLVICIFAVIGFVAMIRWIVGLFTSAERAVESGVANVEGKLHR